MRNSGRWGYGLVVDLLTVNMTRTRAERGRLARRVGPERPHARRARAAARRHAERAALEDVKKVLTAVQPDIRWCSSFGS